MKKKLFFIILGAVFALCFVLCLSACGSMGEAPHVHEFTPLIAELPATCTTTGLKAHYYCEGCKKYFDINKKEVDKQSLFYSDPNAHDYGELVEKVPATCTEPGMQAYYHCGNCNKYFDENKSVVDEQDLFIEIDSDAHDYGELVKEVPATCTEPGMQAYYCCGNCKKYFDKEKNEVDKQNLNIDIDSNAHNYNVENKCTLCDIELQYTENLNYTLIDNNTAYEVSWNSSVTETDIVIPYGYDGLPVTSIGNNAFSECTGLTSITIPAGVTSIGKGAFNNCAELIGVYITEIKAWCNIDFGNISSNPLNYAHNLYLNTHPLSEITADMLQDLTEIKAFAFNGCSSITSISIPEGVTSIGNYAFSGTGITSIYVPASVTSIGEGAFRECSSLESVNFEDDSNLTSIGSYAFTSTNITSIIIPANVTSIGYKVFDWCTSLKSVTFENTTGWSVSLNKGMAGATNAGVTDDTAKNAELLKNKYCGYYWQRTE